MKLRVVAVVALQVMSVAVAYGATRMGTFFAPGGVLPAAKAPKTPAEQTVVAGVPTTPNSNAPAKSLLRPRSQAWSLLTEGELADPWPPRETTNAWDAELALKIVEPWEHQHLSPAIDIVEPWPPSSYMTLSTVALATESRALSLVVDPWSAPTKPDRPTKSFPQLPTQ